MELGLAQLGLPTVTLARQLRVADCQSGERVHLRHSFINYISGIMSNGTKSWIELGTSDKTTLRISVIPSPEHKRGAGNMEQNIHGSHGVYYIELRYSRMKECTCMLVRLSHVN